MLQPKTEIQRNPQKYKSHISPCLRQERFSSPSTKRGIEGLCYVKAMNGAEKDGEIWNNSLVVKEISVNIF